MPPVTSAHWLEAAAAPQVPSPLKTVVASAVPVPRRAGAITPLEITLAASPEIFVQAKVSVSDDQVSVWLAAQLLGKTVFPGVTEERISIMERNDGTYSVPVVL